MWYQYDMYYKSYNTNKIYNNIMSIGDNITDIDYTSEKEDGIIKDIWGMGWKKYYIV